MKDRLWLAQNVSNGIIHQLRDLGISAAEAFAMGEKDWKALEGIGDDTVRKILRSRENWNYEAQWAALAEKAISFVTLDDPDYPARLRNIYHAPYALYYRGHLPAEQGKAVAIVGSRGRSAYGNHVARELAKALGKHKVEVISGMALGIDSDAHKGCLEENGITYAVLGCGVDVIYPRQNAFLYEEILKKGGVLSEFPPGTQPLARQFPSRNRIISGLADKVVVVEAKERSGSLITADFAMEQGRDVYAVPGRITDPLSAGCNRLIRQGAGALISVEDFLEELKIEMGEISTQLDFRRELLDAREGMVYELMDYQPVSLSLLLARLPLELAELLEILSDLKEKGFIFESNPNYFIKI